MKQATAAENTISFFKKKTPSRDQRDQSWSYLLSAKLYLELKTERVPLRTPSGCGIRVLNSCIHWLIKNDREQGILLIYDQKFPQNKYLSQW